MGALPDCPVCGYDFTYWQIMRKEIPFRKFRCPSCSTRLQEGQSGIFRFIAAFWPLMLSYFIKNADQFLILMTIYLCTVLTFSPFAVKLEEKE